MIFSLKCKHRAEGLQSVSRRWVTGLVLLTSLALPSMVVAQVGVGTLNLPKPSRQSGLVAGDFLIVPALTLGYTFDNNLFYEADTQWESPTPAHKLVLVPGVDITSRNPTVFRVHLAASANVDRYLSSNDSISAHNNVGANIGLDVGIMENGPLGIKLSEQFIRSLDRRNMDSPRDFNRHVNRVGADLTFKPGGGALGFTLGYRYVIDFFTDASADWGDLQFHDASLTGYWKFFPFTAATLKVNYQYRDYLDEGGGHYGELTDSTPLRVMGGVTGFITKKLGATALVGWGWSMHDERPLDPNDTTLTPDANDSYSGPLADVSVYYKWYERSMSSVGYSYTFDDSLFSNYVTRHGVAVRHQQYIGQDLELNAELGWGYLIYSQLPSEFLYNDDFDGGEGTPITKTNLNRVDSVFSFKLSASYEFARFLSASATYSLDMLNPGSLDRVYFVEYDGGVSRDYMQWTRHVVSVGLTLKY